MLPIMMTDDDFEQLYKNVKGVPLMELKAMRGEESANDNVSNDSSEDEDDVKEQASKDDGKNVDEESKDSTSDEEEGDPYTHDKMFAGLYTEGLTKGVESEEAVEPEKELLMIVCEDKFERFMKKQ